MLIAKVIEFEGSAAIVFPDEMLEYLRVQKGDKSPLRSSKTAHLSALTGHNPQSNQALAGKEDALASWLRNNSHERV